MGFNIRYLEFREEGRIILKELKIQKTDVRSRNNIRILLPAVHIIKNAGKIHQRPVRPVVLIQDLHFNIQCSFMVERKQNVENACLFIDPCARHNDIHDLYRMDFHNRNMQTGANQRLQGGFRLLHDNVKQKVIAHPDLELASHFIKGIQIFFIQRIKNTHSFPFLL